MYNFQQHSLPLLFTLSNGGFVAPNHDGRFLLISNLINGMDNYKFPSLKKIQTFIHPIEVNCILQMRTLLSGNLIVAGGDSGFA